MRQVDGLRELCLALANNDRFRTIREKHPDDPVVRRTAEALGESGKPPKTD